MYRAQLKRWSLGCVKAAGKTSSVQGSAKNYFLGCVNLIRQEMIHFSNTYCLLEALPSRGLLEGGLPPRGQPVLLVANLKGVARNELVRSDNSDNLRGV